MATEVAFAKTFLAILDKQPQKITADHVEDPRNYPATTPYTLPRLSTSKPMSKRGSSSKTKSTAPTSSSSESASEQQQQAFVKVTVKSPRNPTLELTLPTAQPIATTSMLDIKNAIYQQTCLPVDKLKILHNKKPVADTKTIKDVLASSSTPDNDGGIEFSLMVMGGAATASAAAEALAAKQASSAPAPAPGMETQADADGDTVMTTPTEDDTAAPVVAEGSGPSGAAVLQTEEFWEDLRGFLMQRIRDEKLAGELVGKLRGAV